MLILAIISISGLSLGLFFFLKPALAIEMQRKFYIRINWKIEPISMSREIRNTRLMGLTLLLISLLAIFRVIFSALLN